MKLLAGMLRRCDGNFDGLCDITGNLTRFTVTMDGGSSLMLDGGTLISSDNGVYEFEADVTKTPIKYFSNSFRTRTG